MKDSIPPPYGSLVGLRVLILKRFVHGGFQVNRLARRKVTFVMALMLLGLLEVPPP